jgi:hypothetical protein
MERVKIAVFAVVLAASLVATAGTAWSWSDDDGGQGVSWETVPVLAD